MTNPHNSRRQEVLDALPCSHVDLIEKNGMHRNVAGRWLAKLHAAEEAHIIGWNRSPGGGPFFPTYAKGKGEDAICDLEPIPIRENWHRHMQRKREAQHQRGERWRQIVAQFIASQKRKRKRPSRAKPKPTH
jgi:hypothetical protein